MVLHKFQTPYYSMFEVEMCNLKLNRSALKFLQSSISKNHVEITYEITLYKNVLLEIFMFKELNWDYGSRT